MFTYASPFIGGNVNDARITADGEKAFMFGDGYGITVLSLESGETINRFEKTSDLINRYGDITPDGRYAYGSDLESIGMWDVETGELIRQTLLTLAPR